MAGSLEKHINIVLEVTGNLESSLTNLTGHLKRFTAELKKLQIPPVLADLHDRLAVLDKLKLPNVLNLAKGLERLVAMGTPPNLSPFRTELEKLDKLSAPNILNIARGLKELTLINMVPLAGKLEVIKNNLQLLTHINLPKISSIATGLRNLALIDMVPLAGKIEVIKNSLKTLSGITLPNITNIAAGLKKLQDIDTTKTSSNILYLSTALKNFTGITLPTGLASFATAMTAFSKIDVSKIAKDLIPLGNSLRGMSGIKINSFNNIIKFFEKIQTIKIPSFDKVIIEINKLAQAFQKLSANSAALDILNKIAASSASLDKKLKNTTKVIKDQATAWEKLAVKARTYLQYRIVSDVFNTITNALRGGFTAIVDYDQGLKDLQAITQATTAEVRIMAIAIKDVASKTKFSASETANAMRILGQAGLSAAESIAVLPAVANLATGTLASMETAVDLVTTAIRVFGIQATQSATVADIFANAVNASKLTIDKLRIAMNYVGPVAASANISLQETAAAMMTLANSGIRASTIGTGLRRVLAELVDPSKKLRKAAEEAGISLAELDPSTAPLSAVLAKLGIVLNTTGVAFDLFGKRGAAAALALTADVTGGFESSLESANRFGTAATMAATQMEGLGVAFKNLKDKISLIAVALGDSGLTLVLKGVVDLLRVFVDGVVYAIEHGLTPFIDMITILADDGFGKLVLQITATALALKGLLFLFGTVKVTAITQALIALGASAFTGSAGVLSLSAAMGALRVAIVALTGPVGWAIAGLTILAGVATVAFNKFGENAKDQVRELDKFTEKLASVTSDVSLFSEEIKSMQRGDPTELQVLEFMNKLATKFPEITKEIYETKGELSLLNKVLEDYQAKMNTQKIDEYIKGMDGLANTIIKTNKRIENNKISGDIFDPEAKLKQEEARAEYAKLVGQFAQIGQEVRKSGAVIDWEELFDVKNIKVGSALDGIKNDILTIMDSIEAGVALKAKAMTSSLSLFGLASEWKKELDKGAHAFQKMDELAKSENVGDMLLSINPEVVSTFLKQMKDVTEEMVQVQKDADAGLIDVDELYAKRLQLSKDALTINKAMNDALAKDDSARLVLKADQLEKWYQHELTERLKQTGTDAKSIDAVTFRLWKELQQKKDDFLKGDSTTEKIETRRLTKQFNLELKQLKQNDRERKNILKAYNEDVNLAEANRTISVVDAERKRLVNTINTYATSFNAAKEYNDKVQALALTSEKVKLSANALFLKAEKDLSTAKYRLNLNDVNNAQKALDLQIVIKDKKIKNDLDYQVKLEALTGSAGIKREYDNALAISKLTKQFAEEEIRIAEEKYKKIAALGTIEEQEAAGLEIVEMQRNLALLEIENAKILAGEMIALTEYQWERGIVSVEEYHTALTNAADLGVITWEEMNDKMMRSTDNMIEAFKHGWEEAAVHYETQAERMQDMAETLHTAMRDGAAGALTEWVTKSKTAKEAFMDFAKQTLKEISLIISKMMILELIGSGESGDGGLIGAAISKIPGMASGGEVPGVSPHTRADNIRINATAGEFMHPVKAVRHYGLEFMEAIRTLRLPKSLSTGVGYMSSLRANSGLQFAEGGLIPAAGTVPAPIVQTGDTNLKVVNVLDKDLMGGYLDSVAGEFGMINFISRNRSAIKGLLG